MFRGFVLISDEGIWAYVSYRERRERARFEEVDVAESWVSGLRTAFDMDPSGDFSA